MSNAFKNIILPIKLMIYKYQVWLVPVQYTKMPSVSIFLNIQNFRFGPRLWCNNSSSFSRL